MTSQPRSTPTVAGTDFTAAAHDPRLVRERDRSAGGWGPLSRRTWREHGYLWFALLVAPFAFASWAVVTSLAAGLAVTVVGLFVVGWLVVAARGWGVLYRAAARTMLRTDVRATAPYQRPRGGGFWKHLRAALTDAAGWRALIFGLVSFPVALGGFVLSVGFLVGGLGGITYWSWYRYLPWQEGTDGTLHQGAQFGVDGFADTPGRIALVALIGILLLLAWSPITRALAHVMRLLTINLLGPTRSSLRVQSLEESRGRTVEDADARLRRIERDLHDGTQSRLVAVAMQLGEAKEQLEAVGDVSGARELVEMAHSSTKEALVELREIARGIHPSALDAGLAVALETLAARSSLPTTVDIDPEIAASKVIETIAYFCVAELITNAVKHAEASGVYVLIERRDDQLRLRVRDDGHGGAVIHANLDDGQRTGLAGLVERVRSVDGTWHLDSPIGGPTVVTITLPER